MPAPAPTVEVLANADAEARQRRAAGALLGRGCSPGDRVAFALGSSADLICAVLGAARVGLVPVLLNATLTPAERDALATDADPVVRVFTPAELAALMEGTPTELAPYPLTRSMHYTSGTTGRPKGVAAGLWDEATARAVYEDEASVWQFAADDVHLVCSPTYHTVSIRFSSNTLLAGGSLVVLGRFDASRALHALRQLRPTTTFMVPTHLQRLLALGELGEDETFDSLRLLAHAGEPCPHALKRAVMARLPDRVWEFYGSTEAQFTVCPPDEWLENPGSVGRARAGRRLWTEPLPADDEAAPASASAAASDAAEGGTIWCDMPPFAHFEYWRNPEATAAAWRGTACTVGDLGRLDADGYLFLTGRRQDLIISGGVNVYPAEVEDALAGVPGVREIAVFGVPDPDWGQRVCAAYVAEGPASARASVEDALRAAASAGLAPYKRPKTYVAADELPHTATGKLMRRAVAAHLGLA
jgi:long-chain acyl-CoA synthetase